MEGARGIILLGVFASLAIKYGKPSWEIEEDYFAQFHQDHQEGGHVTTQPTAEQVVAEVIGEERSLQSPPKIVARGVIEALRSHDLLSPAEIVPCPSIGIALDGVSGTEGARLRCSRPNGHDGLHMFSLIWKSRKD
jgi:hypothetical protein